MPSSATSLASAGQQQGAAAVDDGRQDGREPRPLTDPADQPDPHVVDVCARHSARELPGPESTIVYRREAPVGAARAIGRLGAADLGAIGNDITAYAMATP